MRFRFRALNVLYAEALMAVERFPLVLVVSVLAGISVGVLSHKPPAEHWWMIASYTLTLGICLSFSLTLLRENRRLAGYVFPMAVAGSVVLLGLVAAAIFQSSFKVFVMRYVQVSLAVHLVAAFIVFVPQGSPLGFWHFNSRLFTRILTAMVYSAVLYGGLAAAMGASHFLLGIQWPAQAYLWLWVFVQFVFNTWFFLGRIPDSSVAQMKQLPDYPTELRVFTQYLLIPLITLYLLILYAYLVKIVIAWEFPKGMVGYLVSTVSILGMLALLLVHPLQAREENRWLRLYSRGFYLALFPLLVLMFLGTWRRISDYGITEKRYFLLLIDLWIAAMAFYFTFSRKKSIKVIPISLCLLSLVTAVGPWGAYSVSKRSQERRLERLLEKAGVRVDGKDRKAGREVDRELRKEIGSVLSYLNETHGEGGTHFDRNGEDKRRESARALTVKRMNELGMEFVESWGSGGWEYVSYHTTEAGENVKLKGFDEVLYLDLRESYTGKPFQQNVQAFGAAHVARVYKGKEELELVGPGGKTWLRISLTDAIKKMKASRSGAPLRIRGNRALLLVRAMTGNDKAGTFSLTSLSGDLFLAKP